MKKKIEYIKCTNCKEPIKSGRIVMLTYDQRTGTYTKGNVPPEYNQGAFPFGRQCAKAMELEHTLTIQKAEATR